MNGKATQVIPIIFALNQGFTSGNEIGLEGTESSSRGQKTLQESVRSKDHEYVA